MAWQDIKVEIEFTSGVWTDVTDRCWSAKGGRGRSYELAAPNSGSMTFEFDNADGALNPDNTESPYAPNVTLFKRIRVTAAHSELYKILYTGYIERYPRQYKVKGGHFETTPLQAVDTLGFLNRVKLRPVYEQFVLNMKPSKYWPLTDRSDKGEYFDRVTGKVAREMSYGGNPKITTGESPILGDEEQNIPLFTPERPGMPNDDTPPEQFSIIRLTHGAGAEIPNFHTGAWSIMVSFFVPPSVLQIGDCVLLNISAANTGQENFIQLRAGIVLNDNLHIHLNDFIVNGAAGRTINTGRNTRDGFPHTVYLAITDSGEATWKWSFDGSTITSQTADNFNFDDIATRGTLDIGASWPVSNTNHSQAYWGYASNVVVFNRELTQTEVTDMANLANGGLLLQNMEDRIDYILRTIGQSALLGTAVGDGSTIFPGSHAGGSTAASAITDANKWELGNTYVSGDGKIVPVSRHSRLFPVAKFNLGVGEGGGTVYPITSIEMQYDATRLINDAEVSVTGGGKLTAVNQTSIDSIGRFSSSETIETVDESEALARAQYLVSTYADPETRIESIVFEPSSNPDLWELLCQLEINDTVRIEHDPRAGVAVSNKICWVESLDYSISTDGVQVKVELSPAVSENWLSLDDATLGKIGAAANNKISY